ncbi:hypothetical protein [Haloparvum sp. PAK95]|uniref:hypothetical protein n=1 Tax=Haloparvum sp. PAK95 TaxID=3418962 RepID=UPI003D2EA412
MRLRRRASDPVLRRLVEHGSKLNSGVFLAVVLLVGTGTPGLLLFDFTPGFGAAQSTVGAEVACNAGSETVTCHQEESRGVDHVVLVSGGEELDRAAEEPYRAEAPRDELASGATGRQYVVELRNAEDETHRRCVRTVEA